MGLPNCPTYFLLHVLHFTSYMPLAFLFCVFSASCWYIVCVALNAMRISVLLNKLVTLLIIGLWYGKDCIIPCLYEAQHVLGDTPHIIRSSKLH